MEDKDDKNEKIYIPMFGGIEKKYLIYKVKMKALLGRKGCTPLFTTTVDKFPKDNKFHLNKDDDKPSIALWKMNGIWFGYLMDSIDTSMEAGEAAFDIIEQHMTEDHLLGLFCPAWEHLEK